MPEPPTAPPVYYPPQITESVPPVFPRELKAVGFTSRSSTVAVKVSIDETGRVRKAEPLPAKEWVHELMIQSCVGAARRWKFKPARRDTQPIPSEMVLQCVFKP
jgi:outer membrane biosynthesis protein TonB